MISCSVLQPMSCFGSAKVLGGRLQNPKCPLQGGRSGLWGDVEKRLSAGSCIPCQAGHGVLQRHFPSRPFSGPVNSPPVLVTSSRESPASEHHRPGELGDRKYQCEVLPVHVALYYKILNMPGGVRWSLRSGKPVLLASQANGKWVRKHASTQCPTTSPCSRSTEERDVGTKDLVLKLMGH